jgi:hypothetical protein
MLRIKQLRLRQFVGGVLVLLSFCFSLSAENLSERVSEKQKYRNLRKEFAPYRSKLKNYIRHYFKNGFDLSSALFFGVIAGRLTQWKVKLKEQEEKKAISFRECLYGWGSNVRHPIKSFATWQGKEFVKANLSFAVTAAVSIGIYAWFRSQAEDNKKCAEALNNFIRKWPAYQQVAPEEFKFFFNGMYESFLNNNGRLPMGEKEAFEIICEVVKDIDEALAQI